MYSDQFIPRVNSLEAHQAVYRELLRQERKLDLEELKWSIGNVFAAWMLLVVLLVMFGAEPSAVDCILWCVLLMVACSLTLGVQRIRKRADQASLQRLVQRGDLYLPSEAVIGWLRGKAPAATKMSRLDWVTIASPHVDQLQACDAIFAQSPFGEDQMDEIDALIELLLASLREATA